MGFINDLFSGSTKLRYMECGFSDSEAEAMSWIAQQKAKGKFVGATSGLFLAFSWGHWHDRISHYLKLSFSRRITQLGIIMSSILVADYLFTGRRKGANEIIANELLMNNNLFLANVDSLIENFDIFTRKFTDQEIEALNFRKKLVRTNHKTISSKKWIYNPEVDTLESFQKKINWATIEPWANQKVRPTNIGKLIDETGDRLGISQKFVYGWSPLH